jgi:hypothetical protein
MFDPACYHVARLMPSAFTASGPACVGATDGYIILAVICATTVS